MQYKRTYANMCIKICVFTCVCVVEGLNPLFVYIVQEGLLHRRRPGKVTPCSTHN